MQDAYPMTPLPDAFRTAAFAHRGLHDRARGRVENSASAVRAAVEGGWGIEIDLQLSRDGVAMVFHDETLDRLTGRTGPVEALDAAELGQVALAGGTDTVPTLADILALVAGRVPLLVEVKDTTGMLAPTDGRLERAAAAALAGYEGPVAVMSFNPHSVAAMANLAPDVPRGLTTCAYDPDDWAPVPPGTCARLRGIPDFGPTGASFISHEAADLARPRVGALKAEGAAILCWTIRSAEAEARARAVAHTVTFEGYTPART